MRFLSPLLFLSAFTTLSISAEENRQDLYHIFAVLPDADFDAKAIRSIDSLKNPFPAGSSYPVGDLPITKGKFTLIKMLCAHPDETSEGARVVHELLILKTSGKQLVDAYLYTLEWQDQPSARLARMTARNVVLKPGMRLGALQMRRSNGEPAGGDQLLDNVYQGKKVF